MWQSVQQVVRRVALIIGLALGLVVVVFVHPSGTVPADRISVSLWQVTGAEDVQPVIPNWFNEKQDKIYVQPIGLPFAEIEQKFMTAAVGGVPPDLFEYFGAVAQWSTRGALLPLDEFMERDHFDRSSIFPALWEEMMWDGRTYAIPTGTGNEAFFWNKQHFREAGLNPDRPPKTWDELDDYAVRLTRYAKDGTIERAGYIPGYWGPSPIPIFLDWPLQKGAKFLSADGTRVQMATPPCIESLEWEGQLFKRLGRDQLILKRASFGYGAQHGFTSGQLSMMVGKSSYVQEIEHFAPDLDYGVSPLPIPKGGKEACVGGSVWIGIPAGAKHPEAAWEYIKFATSEPAQLRAAEYSAEKHLTAFFPANIQAATSPFQMSLPHMNVFVKSMDFARSATVIPLVHTVFWRTYAEAWDAVMRGQKTAADALRLAQSVTQKALDDQLAYNNFYQKRLREEEASAKASARSPR